MKELIANSIIVSSLQSLRANLKNLRDFICCEFYNNACMCCCYA